MLNYMMVLSRVLCLRAWQKLNTRLMSVSVSVCACLTVQSLSHYRCVQRIV